MTPSCYPPRQTLRLRFRRAMRDRNSWELLLLMLPNLAAVLALHWLPYFYGLALPFKAYRPIDGLWGSAWVGFKNFGWILKSTQLMRALRNSFLYSLWFMLWDKLVGVGIAVLCYNVTRRWALKIYQTVVCLPMYFSMVIVGFITFAVLSPRYGLLNSLLGALGLDPVNVYAQPGCWPVILTLVNTWCTLGSGSLVYYALLMGVDQAQFEAAAIDGANHFQMTIHVALPHLVPMICLSVICSMGSLLGGGSYDLHYLISRDQSVLYKATDILPMLNMRMLMDADYTRGAASGLLFSLAHLIIIVSSNAVVRKVSPDNALW